MSLALRALAWISPAAAMRRAQAFAALNASRAYEAARRDRRTAGWDARAGSANTSLGPALATLRDRSSHMVENSFIGSRTLSVLGGHTIGTGIVMRADTGRDRDDRILNELWQEWCTQSDIEGELDFGGQQLATFRAMSERGDGLMRMITVRRSRRRRVPLALQVLEADHLDHTRDYLQDGRRSMLGVVLGDWNERLGYWLHPHHPHDWTPGMQVAQTLSQFVPRSDVIHLYQAQRPGQVRGVPVLAPILLAARDYDDIMDALVVKLRTESCFGAFVHSSDPARTLADVKQDPRNPRRSVEELSPGMITYLDQGEEVTFAQPTGSGQFEAVRLAALMGASAGAGVTYDQMTGDLRQANYSSLNAGKVEQRRLVEQMQWLTVVPKMLRRVGERFIDTAILAGELRDKPGWRFSYVMPAVEPVNPKTDLDASIAAVRAGRMSPQEFIEAWGRPWREVLAETEAFYAELDKRGIVLDIDPRRTTQMGAAQPEPAAEAAPDSKDTTP